MTQPETISLTDAADLVRCGTRWECKWGFEKEWRHLATFMNNDIENTIDLASAVKIWLETGKWPEVSGPYIDHHRLEFGEEGSYTQKYFNKGQRFVKPVDRVTLEKQVGEWLMDRVDHPYILCKLARRIDELEARIK